MVGTNATNFNNMNQNMLLIPEPTTSDKMPFIDPSHRMGSWIDNRALYKQSVENGSRKLSRNRLNFGEESSEGFIDRLQGSDRGQGAGVNFQRGSTHPQNSLQNTARSKDELPKMTSDQVHQRITTI